MKRYVIASLFVGSLLLVGMLGSTPEAVAEGGGMAVFEAQKCSMCHSVESLGIEAKTKSAAMQGGDLSKVDLDPVVISKFLRKQEQLEGKDHKKEIKVSDDEMAALVEWLRSDKS